MLSCSLPSSRAASPSRKAHLPFAQLISASRRVFAMLSNISSFVAYCWRFKKQDHPIRNLPVAPNQGNQPRSSDERFMESLRKVIARLPQSVLHACTTTRWCKHTCFQKEAKQRAGLNRRTGQNLKGSSNCRIQTMREAHHRGAPSKICTKEGRGAPGLSGSSDSPETQPFLLACRQHVAAIPPCRPQTPRSIRSIAAGLRRRSRCSPQASSS